MHNRVSRGFTLYSSCLITPMADWLAPLSPLPHLSCFFQFLFPHFFNLPNLIQGLSEPLLLKIQGERPKALESLGIGCHEEMER